MTWIKKINTGELWPMCIWRMGHSWMRRLSRRDTDLRTGISCPDNGEGF